MSYIPRTIEQGSFFFFSTYVSLSDSAYHSYASYDAFLHLYFGFFHLPLDIKIIEIIN